jgi:MFS family permease
MSAVFIGFLVIGIAIPVLPLHVHQGLGQSTFLVGLVAGSQFAAAILSRVWAGRHSDTRGPKRAVIVGLSIAGEAGLLYVVSLRFVSAPGISVAILLFGRALLGVGESFIITGAQSWGLAILGLQNTSKVLAWVGSAMFGVFAAGAPIGTLLYARYGFAGVALATTILPMATLLLLIPLRPVPVTARMRTGVLKVMSSVWLPGAGSMGAYTAFLDVALGFGTPALGLLADFAGLGTVFLVSAMAALCAAPIAASFLRPFTAATAARLTISR